MKRTLILLAAAMLTVGTATAQTTDSENTESTSFGQKLSKFWKKVKNEVSYTTSGIFGKEDNDLSLIDGNYYMQVYELNLYKDTTGVAMRDMCRARFEALYPVAKVVSCVIPQTYWLSKPVKEDGKTVGYVQTMYCYVLAKDGTDGFINSKYVFMRAKEVGQSYVNDYESWGRLLRTDVLSREIYDELTKEKE